MVMQRLESAGFDVKMLQRFITQYAEPVDITEKWIKAQNFCYEYEPQLIGTVFRLKGIPVVPPLSVNRREVYEFEPLVFSLVSELPYTFCPDSWEKADFVKDAQVLPLSLNKNSSDPENPWLLY